MRDNLDADAATLQDLANRSQEHVKKNGRKDRALSNSDSKIDPHWNREYRRKVSRRFFDEVKSARKKHVGIGVLIAFCNLGIVALMKPWDDFWQSFGDNIISALALVAADLVYLSWFALWPIHTLLAWDAKVANDELFAKLNDEQRNRAETDSEIEKIRSAEPKIDVRFDLVKADMDESGTVRVEVQMANVGTKPLNPTRVRFCLAERDGIVIEREMNLVDGERKIADGAWGKYRLRDDLGWLEMHDKCRSASKDNATAFVEVLYPAANEDGRLVFNLAVPVGNWLHRVEEMGLRRERERRLRGFLGESEKGRYSDSFNVDPLADDD